MTWMDNFDAAALRRETEKVMRLPVGLASPLWLAFGAAASAGVAWWWMSRMSRPFNIEAKMAHEALAAEPVPAPAPILEATDAEVAVAPVEAAAEVVKAEIDADLAEDDLTRLAGVGPKLAAALAERGITRFAQLAAWTEDELSAIDAALNLRGRAHRDNWIAQAKAFAAL
jgi:predicted flap endonuclease-1-like 5' DNA nuclease